MPNRRVLASASVACLSLCLLASASPVAAEPGAPASDADVAEGKARFEAGRVLYQKKDFERALAEFQAGFALTRNPAFLVNTGLCLKRLGRRDEAIEDLRSFLRLDPQSSRRTEVENHLAELGAAVGRKEPTPPSATTAPVAAPSDGPTQPRRAAKPTREERTEDDDGEPLITTKRPGTSHPTPERASALPTPRATDDDDGSLLTARRSGAQANEGRQDGDGSILRSPWLWGAVGAAVLGGVAILLVTSSGNTLDGGTIGTIDARNR